LNGANWHSIKAAFGCKVARERCLVDVAKRKLPRKVQDLDTLVDLGIIFDYVVSRKQAILRSDWACPDLSDEQKLLAAEAAYFVALFMKELDMLPDEEEEDDPLNQGSMRIRAEWRDIVTKKHDGLWCILCEQGPLLSQDQVSQHLGGRGHRNRADCLGVQTKKEEDFLPESLVMQGIFVGNGLNVNGVNLGALKCRICNFGPVADRPRVEEHVGTSEHITAMLEMQFSNGSQGKTNADALEMLRGNLPHYVKEENGVLTCTLCELKEEAHSVAAMWFHLEGDRHSQRCVEKGEDLLVLSMEKKRMELLFTGEKVDSTKKQRPRATKMASPGIAPSHAATAVDPRASSRPAVQERREFSQAQRNNSSPWVEYMTSAQAMEDAGVDKDLPPGWIKARSKECQRVYFADLESGTVQWHRPNDLATELWQRDMDVDNMVRWHCDGTDFSILETDLLRKEDYCGRRYWIRADHSLRFWEPGVEPS